MPNGLINIDIVAKFAQFERDLQKVKKRLAGMQTTASNFAKGFASAFAGAFSAAALGAAVKGTIDLADNLNDLSKRTQVSVKDLAALKLVAEQNGTSLEDVGKAIQKLNLSVSQGQAGTKEQAEALKRLGINSSDARERLFQLADAYAKSGGSGRVLADIQKVLGKSYAEMIPLLALGGTELRRSAEASETFAQAMARLAPNADKFNDQMAELKQTSAGLAAQLLNAVIPSLSEYGKALADIIEKGSLLDKIKFFSLGFIGEDTLNRISDAGKRVQDYNQQIAKQQQLILELRRVEKQGSPTLAYQERRLADLERTRAGLIAQARKDAAAIKPSAAAPNNVLDFPSAPKTKATSSDPLASLLASTEIGKLKEFDKQVALLNSRFDGGRKNTELYTQAMTKLVETTFAGNFTEFNRQLSEQEETQKALAEHIQATNAELFAQSQAWTEAGRALEAEMRTPLENFNIEMGRLNTLLEQGNISWETYTRAVFKAQESLEEIPVELEKTKSIAEEFGLIMESGFEKAIAGGESFRDVIKGLEQDIIKMVTRLAVTEPLGNFVKGAFKTGGGGIGDIFTNLFGGLFGGFKAEGGPLQPGKWYIAGEKGPEPIWGGGQGAFAAGYGGASPINISINLSGNTDSRSASQIANATGMAVQRAMRRNG